MHKLCNVQSYEVDIISHATKAVLEDASTELSVDTLIDKEMLTSYIEIVGKKPVLDSIALFSDMMPEYISILDSNLVAKDQKAIASEAHKIKGAAGSVGLQRIQSVAQQAQSPELPAWWENIHDWVDEIRNNYLNDIQILLNWIDENFNDTNLKK